MSPEEQPIEEPIFAYTIYLKDPNQRVYAIVRGAAGCELRGKWWEKRHPGKLKSNEPTKVRHKETGEEDVVCAVEPNTRMIRLGDQTDETTRAKWFSVADYEVIGASAMPLSPEQRAQRIARAKAELKELSEMERAAIGDRAPKGAA